MGLPLVVRCSANCQETILSLSGRGDPKPIQGTSLCHYISRSSRVDKLATSSAMSNFNTTLETNSYSRCRSQLFWTWWERQAPRPRDLRPPSHQVQFTSKSFKDDKNKLRVALVLSGRRDSHSQAFGAWASCAIMLGRHFPAKYSGHLGNWEIS